MKPCCHDRRGERRGSFRILDTLLPAAQSLRAAAQTNPADKGFRFQFRDLLELWHRRAEMALGGLDYAEAEVCQRRLRLNNDGIPEGEGSVAELTQPETNCATQTKGQHILGIAVSQLVR